MRFDLQDLRLVIAVAESGSITAGAAASYLATASASERLKVLESSLGAAIFHREPRGVSLTAAGTILVRHAHAVLAQVDALQLELQHLKQGLQGEVRVVTNFVARARLRDTPLIAFLKANPRINVVLEEAPSKKALEMVQQGKADLGVAALGEAHADLAFRELFIDQLVAVTSRSHPISARGEVQFGELLNYDFLCFGAGSALQDYLSSQAAALGRHLKGRVTADSLSTLCHMAEAGLGVGVAPLSLVASMPCTLGIGLTRLQESWSRRRIGIFWSPDMPTDCAAYRFIEYLSASTFEQADPLLLD
jgi:DNA-binding transcriptional LysR family regulator